jgi:leucyl aminopeptidase (aminopeptidase T)
MPGYHQYLVVIIDVGTNIHDVLVEVTNVATDLMVWLETERYERLSRRVKAAKQSDALFENTHDEAQGEPLPSLVYFGTKVATVLQNHQSLVMVIVVVLEYT